MTKEEIDAKSQDVACGEIEIVKMCQVLLSEQQERMLMVRFQSTYLAGIELGMLEISRRLKGGDLSGEDKRPVSSPA